MLPLLREMEQDGKIEIDRISLGSDKVEQRVFAMMPAHHHFFSPSDLEFLDAAITHYWDKTGTEASEDSHNMGWRTRAIGDEMPYELAFLSDAPLEGADLSKALARAEARRKPSI